MAFLIIAGILAVAFLIALFVRSKHRQVWDTNLRRWTGVPQDNNLVAIRKSLWERYTGEQDTSLTPAAPVVENLTDEQKKELERQRQERETFRKSEWERNRQAAAEKDRALGYLERIVDRIINKARGILPFNSILLTFLALQVTLFHVDTRVPGVFFNSVAAVALMALFLSSLLLLVLFKVHWPSSDQLATFGTEFESTARVVRDRSVTLQFALYLSALGLLCILTLAAVASWELGRPSDMSRTPPAATTKPVKSQPDGGPPPASVEKPKG